VRLHSGALLIVDTATKEVQAYLMQKMDFGAALIRTNTAPYRPGMRPEEDALNNQLIASKQIRKARLVNIINGYDRSKLTPNRDYRAGDEFIVGRYEQWSSTFMCGSTSKDSLLKVDIRDPQTAYKYSESKESDPLTYLGRFTNGDKTKVGDPSLGLNRRLTIVKYKISMDQCPAGAAEAATANKGVFYTDPEGKQVFSTPGPNRMRQYIKPGFSLSFEGDFFASDDNFLGMHLSGTEFDEGRFRDFMFGIDPSVN
jgi:hypothetical protein